MELPVIDLAPYLEISSDLGKELDSNIKSLCLEVSRTLSDTGALLVKDPRCTAEDNDKFIDMMEKYFQQPEEFKRLQERPHLHYQVISFSPNPNILFPISYTFLIHKTTDINFG